MLAMRKWVRKYEEASTSVWSIDWSYLLLTYSTADYKERTPTPVVYEATTCIPWDIGCNKSGRFGMKKKK